MVPQTVSDIFEETQVSAAVTPEDAIAVFRENGIFYQANADIGRLAAQLRKDPDAGLDAFTPVLAKDPRLYRILAPYREAFSFPLGSDPGVFYALTTAEGQDGRILVFMWEPKTELEFSHRSPAGELIGVPASNGLFQIPYAYLRKRCLEDKKIKWDEGGVLIVHPRLAFSVTKGFAKGYGCRQPPSKDPA
ncbi:hypothetical protein BN1723_006221 [Verticillium longisporum]|uniref:Uncharacterized protein n=3 Tax=Verticillium TaxID=1036719 RepID=G2X3B3_VERDV|nr:uncharacterized protein VDAG_04898 [Verticillium dahliae VdLs.17]KAG7152802.1 hypothetical protein HYQ46_005509 [Verticillium longisporum]KAH6705768.1 hypothetical protein EV126DRAFT_334645 [Verticillium dahliae]EGY23460.1 hypothetical protein VDAG_04898 [Verticillium dahliae VdLs.17]KAH6708532.1 hypothetical protein EV126DRAFT_331809 [Verticillium dahliae]CRK44628.1 hypothetical protein BN1723_006221 [Verticillium longisporum]